MKRVPASKLALYAKQEQKLLDTLQIDNFNFGEQINRKHIYLFLGEPRTGKTTLGEFASISKIAIHLDTDAYEAENWIQTLQQNLEDFLNQDLYRICIISIGRHRRQNQLAINLLQNYINDDTLVTINRFERLGEVR